MPVALRNAGTDAIKSTNLVLNDYNDYQLFDTFIIIIIIVIIILRMPRYLTLFYATYGLV